MWRWICGILLLRYGILGSEEMGISLPLHSQSRIMIDGRNIRRYLREESPQSPLYRGFGTHFTYAWVGTPPRRVSLIVDTGSHYTAFPCKSCSNCGKHTDHYWDPSSSSTSVTLKCGSQRCSFSQSYTEGSSWQAYKVRDVFWIGGEKLDMLPDPLRWAVNFTFGCQTSETGLFRTQMENGIMGMSSDSNTLPFVLYDKNIISTTRFSLCLLQNGGVMSIGAINSDLHQAPVEYALLVRKSGYFTVSLETIFFKTSLADRISGGQGDEFLIRDLNEPKTKYNTGKGIIIDSGTTDTYLPSAVGLKFKQLFREMTGLQFSNSAMLITPEQFQSLPTFVYRLLPSNHNNNTTKDESITKKFVDIEFPPKHYLEPAAGQKGKYIPRIYLTERSGGVIGANMMTGYNIIFDQMNSQVGFAKSHCKIKGETLYDGATKPVRISRHLEMEIQRTSSTLLDSENSLSKPDFHRFVQSSSFEECIIRPSSPCTARCERGPSRSLGKSRTLSLALRKNLKLFRNMLSHSSNSTSPGYYAEGYQRTLMNESCVRKHYFPSNSSHPMSYVQMTNNRLEQFSTCYVACDSSQQPVSLIENSDFKTPFCVNSSWGECTDECLQSRTLHQLRVLKNYSGTSYQCIPSEIEKRTCSKEKCLFKTFSECAYILQLSIPSFDDRLWSTAWKDELIYAMSQTLKVDSGYIDIPHPPQETANERKQIVYHIRLPVLEPNAPNFDPATAKSQSGHQTKLTSNVPKCTSFPLLTSTELKERKYYRLKSLFLRHLYSIEYPTSGDWRWIREENVNIFILQPERGNLVELTMRSKQKMSPFDRQGGNRHDAEADSPHLINFENPDSLRSLLCVSFVVLVTICCYFYYKRREQKIREKLERPRDGIEGRYRMIGYSR